MSLSTVSYVFNNTPRYFTWSEHWTRTPFRKTLDGADFSFILFWTKRCTNCFVGIKDDFLFCRIIITFWKIFRKTLDGAGCSTSWDERCINYFVGIKNDFVFSRIITTNIQKGLNSTNATAKAHISLANTSSHFPKANLARCTLEAACWLGLSCWGKNVANMGVGRSFSRQEQ